jgi:hypothetical protein
MTANALHARSTHRIGSPVIFVARIMLNRVSEWSSLKAWGTRLAERVGILAIREQRHQSHDSANAGFQVSALLASFQIYYLGFLRRRRLLG